ncbi:hypothetical protein G6F56_004061 [Rhizopus delemar]|nr:hypothetical protein G6F56_004061 [Rhizopus delemar]
MDRRYDYIARDRYRSKYDDRFFRPRYPSPPSRYSPYRDHSSRPRHDIRRKTTTSDPPSRSFIAKEYNQAKERKSKEKVQERVKQKDDRVKQKEEKVEQKEKEPIKPIMIKETVISFDSDSDDDWMNENKSYSEEPKKEQTIEKKDVVKTITEKKDASKSMQHLKEEYNKNIRHPKEEYNKNIRHQQDRHEQLRLEGRRSDYTHINYYQRPYESRIDHRRDPYDRRYR